MRGKIIEQDLTDYTLNELRPDERLYVESMLAVSEECRHDVYQMLDLREMLKEGYERQEEAGELLLSHEQRSKVLHVSKQVYWGGLFRRAAAVLILGVGAAYMIASSDGISENSSIKKMATVSDKVESFVEEARDKGFAKTAEEYIAAQMKTVANSESSDFQFVVAPAECTPLIFEKPLLVDLMEM